MKVKCKTDIKKGYPTFKLGTIKQITISSLTAYKPTHVSLPQHYTLKTKPHYGILQFNAEEPLSHLDKQDPIFKSPL
jgi:hypothetical protein